MVPLLCPYPSPDCHLQPRETEKLATQLYVVRMIHKTPIDTITEIGSVPLLMKTLEVEAESACKQDIQAINTETGCLRGHER